MGAQRFAAGYRFQWRGATYEVRQLLPEGKVSVEDLFTGGLTVVDLPTLVQALFDGELRFAVTGRQGRPGAGGSSTASQYVDLADCPSHLVRIARYRLEAIQPLLELAPRTRTRARVTARVQEVKAAQPPDGPHDLGTALSVASLYRWIKDYTQSGGDLRSLIPNTGMRGGRGTSRLSPEVEAIATAAIQERYLVREAATIDDAWHETMLRIAEENRVRAPPEQLTGPSRRTLARRIGALDQQRRRAAREGKPAARRAATQYGQTMYPQVPLERVEIDHTRADLVVIDDRDNLPLGRLTLTYCLDVATRYPLGYYLGFEPPSYLTVMECLHHAIRPKEGTRERYGTAHEWIAYGIPLTLVVDNGREFVGQDLRDACLLLGIVLEQAPLQTPQFKAGIERLFGTLNTMLFHTLPGTTFSNPARRGDYDSARQACVYLSDVDRVMNIFIVDIYAQRFHRGLEGIPAQRWAEAQQTFSPRVPPSAEELAVLLGRVVRRVIQPYGIQFQSLRYNSSTLAPLRTRLAGAEAKVKYHPADLSRLYVHDPFEQRYIEVPALDQEYTQGLSLWKHRIIRRVARSANAEVDVAALGRAKRQIQDIVAAGRSRRQAGSRQRLARWETGGKPTRTVAEEREASVTAPLPPTSPPAALVSANAAPEGAPPPDETGSGWEVTYDLPRSRRAAEVAPERSNADAAAD